MAFIDVPNSWSDVGHISTLYVSSNELYSVMFLTIILFSFLICRIIIYFQQLVVTGTYNRFIYNT